MINLQNTRVDAPIIMTEAAQICGKRAINIAFEVMNDALTRIAERAIELDDTMLLEQLRRINYVKEIEPPPS
jgi:hypothetical protein